MSSVEAPSTRVDWHKGFFLLQPRGLGDNGRVMASVSLLAQADAPTRARMDTLNVLVRSYRARHTNRQLCSSVCLEIVFTHRCIPCSCECDD